MPQLNTVQGVDTAGTSSGGIGLLETYLKTGQQFRHYCFLIEGETGLYTFTRVDYYSQ